MSFEGYYRGPVVVVCFSDLNDLVLGIYNLVFDFGLELYNSIYMLFIGYPLDGWFLVSR